jgi:hypothetical protein
MRFKAFSTVGRAKNGRVEQRKTDVEAKDEG